MAKISLDLNQFKANGVYTVEYDESEITVVNSEQLRLIVGFSRKGPFNAPVFLKDTKSARKIFGEIDTLLEKRGSFFHRAIETALRTGPVYAINLLPLDNTPTGDKIDYRSFSLSNATVYYIKNALPCSTAEDVEQKFTLHSFYVRCNGARLLPIRKYRSGAGWSW